MFFDLSTHLGIKEFGLYAKKLLENKSLVELKKKSIKRSLKQNSYQHLLFTWFSIASETGYTPEEVKQDIYKRHVCADVFVKIKRTHEEIGDVYFCRSTADLDTKETNYCIEKFRNWAMKYFQVYLPAPNEEEIINEIQDRIYLRGKDPFNV